MTRHLKVEKEEGGEGGKGGRRGKRIKKEQEQGEEEGGRGKGRRSWWWKVVCLLEEGILNSVSAPILPYFYLRQVLSR